MNTLMEVDEEHRKITFDFGTRYKVQLNILSFFTFTVKGVAEMRKLIIIFAVLFVSILFINSSEAGTLDRGIQVDAFFIAGSAGSNPYVAQLKYQMAIDTRVGLKNRYTSIANSFNTYNYDDCSFDTNNTGTFNTFDSTVSGGSGDVVINNTY